MAEVSIIVPARDEAGAIGETVQDVAAAFRGIGHTCEIIVVDDGSQDATSEIGLSSGARVITHPTGKGYGNALLTGIRNAQYPWIAITDADGTYPVDKLPAMLDRAVECGVDMVVGARQWNRFQERMYKRFLRWLFGALIHWVVGEEVPDINSGLRVIRRDMLDHFSSALSGSFSFTTSITIIAFQTGRHVHYMPVDYLPRKGASHVRLGRDTLRALQIVFMTIILFNPIKLFLAQSLVVVACSLLAAILALLVPSITTALLLSCAGVWTANIVLAIGFIAVRLQLGLADMVLPRRGYEPDARSTESVISGAPAQTRFAKACRQQRTRQ